MILSFLSPFPLLSKLYSSVFFNFPPMVPCLQLSPHHQSLHLNPLLSLFGIGHTHTSIPNLVRVTMGTNSIDVMIYIEVRIWGQLIFGRCFQLEIHQKELISCPGHTYPDIFENGDIFLRLNLPSTRKLRFRTQIRRFQETLSRL